MALKPASLQWSDDGRLLSLDYGDVYFQSGEGLDESRYVFLEQNKLADRFAALDNMSFTVAELGFGTGLNFLLTADLFLNTAPATAQLDYVAFEKHPILKSDLEKIYRHWPELAPIADEILRLYPPMTEGMHTISLAHGRIRLILVYGDVTDTLPQMIGNADCWYLDGFAPDRNDAMWSEQVLSQIAARTKPGGTLSTFTVAGDVRRGLLAHGFNVEKVKGFGIKWSMTVATMTGTPATAPGMKTIAVIGAGIAGCSIARALADRGHRIALIDRAESFCTGASGNTVGVVYPKMTVDPSPMGAYHLSAFSHARNDLLSRRITSWSNCGVLHKGIDDEHTERHRDMIQRNAFPADLAVHWHGDGLFQSMAGMVRPREWASQLIDHPYVQKLYAQNIGKISRTEKQWRVYGPNENALIDADIVIVACGWHSKLFDQTSWVPLQSLRGQLTHLTPTHESKRIRHVLCHDGYISPLLEEGFHLAGATFTRELPDSDATRDADDIYNVNKLKQHLPQLHLEEKNITGNRAAFRAATPDKLPMIGPVPKQDAFIARFRDGKTEETDLYYPDLYIATGFGAHGMTGAPFAAQLLSAMISDTPLPVVKDLLRHMLPERFILRDIKRGKTVQ